MQCSLRRNQVTFAKFDLAEAEQTLGSANDNTIKIRSSTVSNHHARLLARDGKAFLEDLGSTNGTLLNRKELTGEAELHNGDVIVLGDISFKLYAPDLALAGVASSARAARATRAAPSRGFGGWLADSLLFVWKAAIVVALAALVGYGIKKTLGPAPPSQDTDPSDAVAMRSASRDTANRGAGNVSADRGDPAMPGPDLDGAAAARPLAPDPFGEAATSDAADSVADPNRPSKLTNLARAYALVVAATEKEYKAGAQLLFGQYSAYLNTLQQDMMKQGDLERTLAARQERESFDSSVDKAAYFLTGQKAHLRPNSLPQFAEGRAYCAPRLLAAGVIRDSKLAAARVRYARDLRSLQKRLTMDGRLEAALCVKSEWEMLAATVPPAPAPVAIPARAPTPAPAPTPIPLDTDTVW